MTSVKRAVFIILGVYGFCAGFGFSLVHTLNKTLPEISSLETYIPCKITRLYDRNGKVIREFYEERRIPITLEDIPKPLIEATIAVEDKKFYSHWGVDLLGITRATFANILHMKVVQGGSTISQQLACNLFLTKERSVLRKIKEALLAIQIERIRSKSEILELYLNQIYYGNGAYGVEAASQVYFGKPTINLTLPECALLVGLSRAPTLYNPFLHPASAIERRSLVLTLMAQEGIISEDEEARLKNAPLGVISARSSQGVGLYFVEEARKWVSERFGPDLLYRGGASIYTTLDLNLQLIAERVANDWIANLYDTYVLKDSLGPLQTALLALDPKSGAILAEVGGRDFRESMFNRAVQARRQPGSSFKPFTWLTALESGYTPASIVLDEPIVVDVGDTTYSPHNFDDKFLGPVTLREGLALSRNLVAVRLIMDIGPRKVVSYARRLGITAPLEPVISLALGCNSVTLLDMVSSFATFANYGMRITPYMIQEIVDSEGKILYEHKEFREQIISPELAYLTVSLMQSVLDEGTGVGARLSGFTRPAAGKTGTTNDCADAWFVGFTPSLVCGVWIGYDQMMRIYKNATGARFALPMWTNFMNEALKDEPIDVFCIPPGIVKRKICKSSGKLANSFCKDVREEAFIHGTEPTTFCNIHGPLTREAIKERGKFERLDSKGEHL